MTEAAIPNLTFFSTKEENEYKIDAAHIESRNMGGVNSMRCALTADASKLPDVSNAGREARAAARGGSRALLGGRSWCGAKVTPR
jgi:hypothetical protein